MHRCFKGPRDVNVKEKTLEYYDDAEFVERFRVTKEEMRSDKFTLTPGIDHNAGQKKSYQKRYN